MLEAPSTCHPLLCQFQMKQIVVWCHAMPHARFVTCCVFFSFVAVGISPLQHATEPTHDQSTLEELRRATGRFNSLLDGADPAHEVRT